MKIELVRYDESTDTAELDVDEAGRQYLLELGFNAMLKKVLDEMEAVDEREKNQSV
jgi:hypothetical protein